MAGICTLRANTVLLFVDCQRVLKFFDRLGRAGMQAGQSKIKPYDPGEILPDPGNPWYKTTVGRICVAMYQEPHTHPSLVTATQQQAR